MKFHIFKDSHCNIVDNSKKLEVDVYQMFPYQLIWNCLLLLKENTRVQGSMCIICVKQNQKQKLTENIYIDS